MRLLSVRSHECGHICVGGCGVGSLDWAVSTVQMATLVAEKRAESSII